MKFAEGHKSNETHGMRYHPFYERWKNIRRRCLSPKNSRYKDWGGRGITICKEWDDAGLFISYIESLPNAGEDGYSLDRIDNDGNYEPGNLRWATNSEQSLNQRQRKTHTNEKHISYCEKDKGNKKYRVSGGKRFLTLDEALAHRKEKHGF